VTVEPRRNLRPRIATRSQWPRIEALLRNRAFAADYARACDQWRHGMPGRVPGRHLLAPLVCVRAGAPDLSRPRRRVRAQHPEQRPADAADWRMPDRAVVSTGGQRVRRHRGRRRSAC
jgi:hypothetical protein